MTATSGDQTVKDMLQPTVKEMLQEFRGEVNLHFSQVGNDLTAINNHLTLLNGSVARHEQALTEIREDRIREDERQKLLDRIDEREEEKIERRGDRAWDFFWKGTMGLLAGAGSLWYAANFIEKYL